MPDDADPMTTPGAGDGGSPPETSSGLGWPQDPIAAQEGPHPGVASGLGWPSSVVSRETPARDHEG